MRVVVTGGAGFIGSHVTRELATRGHHVTVYDNLTTGHWSNLAGIPHQRVHGDILDRRLLNRVADDIDAVVHLAALTSVPGSLIQPWSTHQVNVTGTLNVLDAARRAHAHVVFASSAAVYGHADNPAFEDLPTQPISPYGASKAAAESYLAAYTSAYELPTLTLRLFNVYGPGQSVAGYAAVVPAFLAAVEAGRPLTVHGTGTQTRDFVHVATVAEVIADAVQRRVASPVPVNVGTGTPTTVLDLAGHVQRLFGPLRVEHVAGRGAADVHTSVADATRLRVLFPDVQRLMLADGLAAMAALRPERVA